MTLPDSFATTGFHATCTGDKITRYQVVGERSSGTNFVKRLLGRNTALTPGEDLGWKHGFPHMRAVPANLAVICVVRSPLTWARSMHAKPWHTTPALQKLAFSDFIRAPWDTIIDRPRYFDKAEGDIGQALQFDRDPLTGKRFDNLFALRTAKLRGALTHLNRDCTCIVLRMEEATTDPEATLTRLCTALDTQPNATFRPVVKRLGSKFKPAVNNRPDTPKDLSPQDRAFVQQATDTPLETALGYAP